MNALNQAREFLEARQEGSFERTVQEVLLRGGVMHSEPEVFYLLLPVDDEPGVMHIVFFCGNMRAALRSARGLDCRELVWERAFLGRPGYGVHRRAVKDFLRHA